MKSSTSALAIRVKRLDYVIPISHSAATPVTSWAIVVSH